MKPGITCIFTITLLLIIILTVSAGCISPVQQSPASSAVNVVESPPAVFKDQEFSFQFLRTVGASYSGEADIGECLATASRIKEGDFESWYSEWKNTADTFRTAGDKSLAAGHRRTAMEAYYRAATYYRTAEFFLHGNSTDPRIVETWGKSRETFCDALALDAVPYEIVSIPYENTTLPGYFYMVDNSGKSRTLLIVQTGFDGCQEELHPYAVEGVKRGYNVLTFEGPGQGEVIRVQNIPFRSDWENVIKPVVDYAVSRPEVDEDRIALWGISLGGYLAPRGAAYEPGIAALVTDPGTYDVGENLLRNLQEGGGAAANMTKEDLREWLRTDPAEFNDAIRKAMADDTGTRWLNENGMFVFSAGSPAQFWAKWMDFSLVGTAGKIQCPTLVCAGAADHFDPDGVQAQALYDNLTCERKLMVFSDEYGAGSHCQLGAFAQSFGAKFDWLDDTMGMDG
ncbi:alpha/beta hydrolase family protein [Methanoplanus limicola]|uniref:Dipeptidyl aminopeptidase/acylaminoacyl-peptidase related protein n=1 Tax=Methanoplanus limicola DSM 2279 TaxID=937775 RepID=H1YYA3_9EURY|nr:alpha/beta fold hydrolase [Methanoplanus limicola]EHQ34198.1 dipeptidyl aminopeptidase/acylaminoacyl-peptidase related protein [Methanoplanus limicola DSM 2279]